MEQSFLKSIFHGVIAESLIFPFPSPSQTETDNLNMMLDSVRKFAAAQVDSVKIDKFVALMENFGLLDLTRTGRIALPRVSDAPTEPPAWQGPASTDY